ncbi:nucleotide-binding protein, partial [Pseudomonas sp. MAFF 730085]|nr:nucleotide-binding protein [Pseudomonas kitaguniensis]
MVARFLERIGFEAVILHEQANQGRTVIEKVEAHGDVGFAVVLLTPDDEG